MSKKSVKKYIPKIKLWEGTVVHASLDTLVMQDIKYKLRDMGFPSVEHKGFWSIEDLHNGKAAFVTHTRRLGAINPYSISQRDAEKFMIQMYRGSLPRNLAMMVASTWSLD